MNLSQRNSPDIVYAYVCNLTYLIYETFMTNCNYVIETFLRKCVTQLLLAKQKDRLR